MNNSSSNSVFSVFRLACVAAQVLACLLSGCHKYSSAFYPNSDLPNIKCKLSSHGDCYSRALILNEKSPLNLQKIERGQNSIFSINEYANNPFSSIDGNAHYKRIIVLIDGSIDRRRYDFSSEALLIFGEWSPPWEHSGCFGFAKTGYIEVDHIPNMSSSTIVANVNADILFPSDSNLNKNCSGRSFSLNESFKLELTR